MTQKIFKYPFQIQDEFELELPLGAEILFVEKQQITSVPNVFEGMNPGPRFITAIWAKVDTKQERKEQRLFKVVGTGHEFDSKMLVYIGSVMMNSDQLVWHIFERIRA